jgi:hypothetical protein
MGHENNSLFKLWQQASLQHKSAFELLIERF